MKIYQVVNGEHRRNKPKKGQTAYLMKTTFLDIGNQPPLIPFTIWGVEEYQVGGGIPCGIGIDSDLEFGRGDFIVG